jgi:flagellar hook-associated protein 3 FlgL
MTFRVTNMSTSSNIASYIALNRQRSAEAQEQLTTGKRINRPSDDPTSAGAVMRLRTSQNIIDQFRRTASSVKDNLLVADGALDSFEQRLDRTRAVLARAGSGLISGDNGKSLAVEIDGLRSQFLAIANMRSNDQYVFGGTRQDAPPFDPATLAPSATASAALHMQLEPDTAPVASSVMAETVFSDATGTIFETLTDVAAALRGTGDEAADKATILEGIDRLAAFSTLSAMARTRIGSNINAADAAVERLGQNFLALESSAERMEGADFVESALALKNSENALEATLQASALVGRRSLIDFLG